MAPTDAGKLAPAEREMTVRHLFTHTSGVRDPRSRAETYAFPTMDAYMKDFARLPLQAQPGAKWIYGDSLDVLGYLVERVSKQRLDRFLQQRVLDPLGMTDTHYWPPAAKQRRRALLVVDGKDDPQRLSREPAAARRGANVHRRRKRPAHDRGRLLAVLPNAAQRRRARRKTPAGAADRELDRGEPSRARNPVRARPGLRPGRRRRPRPGQDRFALFVGSYYWGGSQGTLFWIDPAEELIGVLMTQARPAGRLKLRQKFAALAYSAIID